MTSSTARGVPRSPPGRGVVVVVQFAPDSPNYFWIGLGFLPGARHQCPVPPLRTGQFALAVRDDQDLPPHRSASVIRYRLDDGPVSRDHRRRPAASTSSTTCSSTLTSPSDQPSPSKRSSPPSSKSEPSGAGHRSRHPGALPTSTATFLRNRRRFLAFLAGRSGLDVMIYGVLLIVIILVCRRASTAPSGTGGSAHEHPSGRGPAKRFRA